MRDFLPISQEDMTRRGWDELDFICVTGDAYVDHPSFGMAIISRVIEEMGFRVGIIAQPEMKSDKDFRRLGAPKYGFFVNSGNIDSMVTHYTAAKRKRSEDSYSPGGIAGKRPDRAVIAYTKRLNKLFSDKPVIIGGIEASLRRFAHYDYWDDAVRPSVLAESGADILSYGMGENQTRQIAKLLADGVPVNRIIDIRGTCVMVDAPSGEGVECASFEAVKEQKEKYAKAVGMQYKEQDPVSGKTVYQKHGDRFLKQNPPMPPLTTAELDAVYELPFMNYYHPIYEGQGGVPAIREVEFSLCHNRGCFGSCNFCALTFHQGRAVTSRSENSVIAEAERMVKNPRFKGYIHDVGGPTANFRRSACKKTDEKGACPERKCLAPEPCKNLEVDHTEYLELLRKLRRIPEVKKVFIRSGIRFDYLTYDKSDEFFRELVSHHVSGQLKVAPEHISDHVLRYMGKPPVKVFDAFVKKYYQLCKEAKKEQYLVPYLMSSHPGSRLSDAIELALYLKKNNIRPEQVQDFYPTPGSLSTAMFYTGLDPLTMKPVYIPRTEEEKAMQRALLQYTRPQNHDLVRTALKKAKREDLIGFGKEALVPPAKEKKEFALPENNTAQNRKREESRSFPSGKRGATGAPRGKNPRPQKTASKGKKRR